MSRSRNLPKARRLFTRRRSRFTTTLLALAAIVVTGCADQLPEPPHKDYSDLKVEWVAMNHDVAFANASAIVSAGELRSIEGFLDTVAVKLTDQIALDPGSGADPELSAARADAIAQKLRRRLPGVRVRLLTEGTGKGPQIIVGRYVAVPPECAGWMSPEQRYAAFANPNNTTDGNLGCSTASNFAAMVADPGDIKRGRDLTPGDAAAHALGIERYRKLESPHPHSMMKLGEVE